MQDLAAPGGQSPSRTTQSGRESFPASDIEMISLVSAQGDPDHIHDTHESNVNTVVGVSDPPNTPNPSEHRPNIDSRCKAITAAPVKRPSTYNRLVMDTWICETIAMAFSIACVVAIAFTVGSCNGESIPELRWGVTLNALISILSTAARAALFFVLSSSIGQLKWCWLVRRGTRLQDLQVIDEGSRGPLGAIKVLAKWIGGPLASLGAVITICMIAFSPFLQQLVAYPTVLAETTSLEATTPQAVNYTLLWDFQESKDTMARLALRKWLDANAAYGSDKFAPIATCPRPATCTWENYKSIGWCSKCRKAAGHLSDCVVKDHRSSNTSEFQEFCQVVVDNTEAKPADENELLSQKGLYDDPSTISLQYSQNYLWAANISSFVADDASVIDQPVIMFIHAAISQVEEVFQDLYHSDQPALQIDHISECALTLCEIEYAVTIEDGVARSIPVSIDYGKRFQSGSCWQPENSAEGVVLPSPDGGHTRVN